MSDSESFGDGGARADQRSETDRLIDAAIGRRLRTLRTTQQEQTAAVAAALNIPLEHVDAVEAGRVPLSAAQALAAAKFFRVSLLSLFQEVDGAAASGRLAEPGPEETYEFDRLMRAFLRIEHPGVRADLLTLVEAVGLPQP